MYREPVEPGESLIVRIQAPDVTFTTLYPQVKIYDSTNTLVATVNLTHITNGLYTGSWTATTEGKYYTQGLFYSDAGYTTLADVIQPDSDSIDVCHYKFRPSFGGGGGTEVVVKSFTDEELKKVAQEVYMKIYPELIKEIKVNVTLDDRKLNLLKNEIVDRINKVLISLPQDIDYKKIFEFQKQITDSSNKKISQTILGSSSKDELQKLISRLSDVFILKQGLADLVSASKNLGESKEELENISQLAKLLKELDNKLVNKDKLDDKRIKYLVKMIQNIKLNTNEENEDLKNGLSYLLNGLNPEHDEI